MIDLVLYPKEICTHLQLPRYPVAHVTGHNQLAASQVVTHCHPGHGEQAWERSDTQAAPRALPSPSRWTAAAWRTWRPEGNHPAVGCCATARFPPDKPSASLHRGRVLSPVSQFDWWPDLHKASAGRLLLI